MRRFFLKALILAMLLSVLVPFTVMAKEEIAVYNCGKQIELEYGLKKINNRYYLFSEELELLNLELENNIIYDRLGNTMKISDDTDTVFVNDVLMVYENALVYSDNGFYISLELTAECFSRLYEISDNIIYLWISDNMYDFAHGTIYLSEPAPEGGLAVRVLAGQKRSLSSGGSGTYVEKIGSPGYLDAQLKPMYNSNVTDYRSFAGYRIAAEKTVTIPEGSAFADYYLATEYDFSKNVIACYVETDDGVMRSEEYYTDSTHYYDLSLNEIHPTINGMIELPDSTENDVGFKVIAHGTEDFIYSGTIPAGKMSAEYSVAVDKNDEYSMELIFIGGEYARILRDEKTEVKTAQIWECDFEAVRSNWYNVRISLPDDYSTDSDIYIDVYLQSAKSPYYILDTKTISLDSAERSSEVRLYDDMNSKKVICYYSLLDDYDGLFGFAHYSAAGASFDICNSDKLTADCDSIEMTLLRSKQIDVNVTLPKDDVAACNIEINAYPIIASYPVRDSNMSVVTKPSEADKGDEAADIDKNIIDDIAGDIILKNTMCMAMVESSKNAAISAGEAEGRVGVQIPDEDGYGYYLELEIADSENKYFDTIYYAKDKSTSVLKNADTIDNKTKSVSVELIGQKRISGYIDAVGFKNTTNRITAMVQISGVMYASAYAEIYGAGEYFLNLSDEFDNCILRLSSSVGRVVYYKNKECSEELSDAEVLTVNDDMASVNFLYSGCKPPLALDMTVSEESKESGKRIISLKNTSDFAIDDVTVYVGFYDKNGALKNVLKKNVGTVEAASSKSENITIPTDYQKGALKIKAMVWQGNTPLGEAEIIKYSEVDEEKLATLFITANETNYYKNGKLYEAKAVPMLSDGVFYISADTVSDALGWRYTWSKNLKMLTITTDEGDVIKLYKDSLDATLNDDKITLSSPIVVTDYDYMIPIASIAEYIGCDCVWFDEISSLAIYDSIDARVKLCAENGLIDVETAEYDFTDDLYGNTANAIIANLHEKLTGREMSETFFDEDEKITRVQYLKILCQAAHKLGLYIPTVYDVLEFSDFTLSDSKSHWAGAYVYGLKQLGILDGVYKDTLSAGSTITAREALALAANTYKVFTCCIFPDVSPDNPYALAITNSYNRGIMVGYETGEFLPKNGMLRSELARIITFIADAETNIDTDFKCADADSTHWAYEYIAYCASNGTMPLENGCFRPDDKVENIEVISAFMNYLGYLIDTDKTEIMLKAKEVGLLENIGDIDPEAEAEREVMSQLTENLFNIKK